MRLLLVLPALLAGFLLAAAEDEPLWYLPLTKAELADIEQWIPQYCCRTNNCCFETPSAEIEELGEGKIRIVATGQILDRTDLSKIGKTIRCACDQQPAQGGWGSNWVVHRNANTRCIFPAVPWS